MSTANTIASAISFISVALALLLGIILVFLLIRRRGLEGKNVRDQKEQEAITRHLAAVLAGNIPNKNFSRGAELKALNYTANLVRGENRDKLLAYAENKGLFKDPIRKLSNRKAEKRIDAVRQLEQFTCKTCIDALDRTMHRDKDVSVRLEAAIALSRANLLPPPEELIEVLNLKHESLTRVHVALFRSLVGTYKAEIQRLTTDHRYERLQPLLIESLGWTNDLAISSQLATYAQNNNPDNRTAAIRAARHLRHPGASAWTMPMLDDPSDYVRIQAAQACGEMRVKASLPKLKELLDDENWWVRSRAQTAIETIEPVQDTVKAQEHAT